MSVVVPAFNEAASLTTLVERISASVAPLGSFETIVVDDGSTDDTWDVLKALSRDHPELIGIRLQRNFGQHPAVSAGFSATRGRVVITIDADLQNPPEEIPKLVSRLGPDCDVASGWRLDRKDGLSRKLPSRLMNLIIAKLTGVRLNDYGCMLRAYKRKVIEQVQACPEMNKSITALVSWLGVRIVEVPVEHHSRASGRSRYGYWKLLRMNFDIVTGFTTGLLQFVSLSGMLMALVGFAAAIGVGTWRILHGGGPIGANTFVALLLFLSGAQLVAIGTVGEYVSRIFVQVQGRPYYIVSEATSAVPGPLGG
jgi:undecaprenyl-phosphate 4-deoxy-4-formamido-L-arabinose transferase